MTNYYNYPKHRLIKNSCVIYFWNRSYSWCILTNSQRRYLLNSDYIDRKVKQVDVVLESGELVSFKVPEFKNWLKENIK